MFMTMVQFRAMVKRLGDTNGPNGPNYFYEYMPVVQVRFAKSGFNPELFSRWDALREHVRTSSDSNAIIASDRWLFEEGYIEVMINPCGDNPLSRAFAALTWLNTQILAARQTSSSSPRARS